MPCQCQIIHHIRGRLRLRIRGLPGGKAWAGSLTAYLRTQAGVQEVHCNPACQSVTLTYNPEILQVAKLVNVVNGLNGDQLQAYRSAELAPLPIPAAPWSWWPLGISTAALALSLTTEFAWLPWLLLGTGLPLFKRAYDSLVPRLKPNADTLDAAALTALTIKGQMPSSAILLWLIYLGEFIRDRTAWQMQQEVAARFNSRSQLLGVQASEDQVRSGGSPIQAGDELVVPAGALIPVDGVVCQGQAQVDQQNLTGEAMPVAKGLGDLVYAGTAVKEGELRLRVAKVGDATRAGQIMRLFENPALSDTQRNKQLQQCTECLVPWCFLGAGAGYLTTRLFKSATSLLIIDYCTGVRVAGPTTTLAALISAARQGILIKEGRHLELLTEIDTMVFAGRGSLSRGSPEVLEVISYRPEVSSEEVLALAAGAEKGLLHPVATAMVNNAVSRGLDLPPSGPPVAAGGLGVETMVAGSKVQVGCQRFMKAKRVALAKAKSDIMGITDQGCFPALVSRDGQLLGLVIYQDPLRPEAPEVIQTLRQRGIREVALVTGERASLIKPLAEQVGISKYIAEAGPKQKADFFQSLRRQGRKVAVIIDGRGEYHTFDPSEVGLAVGGGTQLLLESGPLVVIEKNLGGISQALDLSRDFKERSELHWDINFYSSTMALALAVLGFIGPMGAILLNNGITVLTALNGLRPWWSDSDIKSRP